MKRQILVLLAVGFIQWAFAAEQKLDIPQSPAEMKQFMDAGNSRCSGCAVVTSVRSIKPEGSSGQNAAQEANRPMRGDSPVEETRPVTIAGTGPQTNKELRQSQFKPPAPAWRIAVRYDDGTYATFDQAEKPALRKGDRVRVVNGRVEPR